MNRLLPDYVNCTLVSTSPLATPTKGTPIDLIQRRGNIAQRINNGNLHRDHPHRNHTPKFSPFPIHNRDTFPLATIIHFYSDSKLRRPESQFEQRWQRHLQPALSCHI